MKKSQVKQAIEKSCIQVKGMKQLNFEKLQENGLLPTPKSDDRYLNQFSPELALPLHLMPFPMLLTTTIKKSKRFEKTSSIVIETALSLESELARVYAPHISIIDKTNVDEVDNELHYKITELFVAGHDSIAYIVIEDNEVLIPVTPTMNFAEITLQAIRFMPGHALVFTNSESALSFYQNNKEHYVIPKREEYLDALEEYSTLTGQNQELFPTLLQDSKNQLVLANIN